MLVWRKLEPAQKEFQGGVITIGNFDGLHFGHQALFAKARASGAPVIVITFDPHPAQVLRPEVPLLRLFPRADLEEQLPKFGIDLLVILPFDKKLAGTGPQDFWRQYITRRSRPGISSPVMILVLASRGRAR